MEGEEPRPARDAFVVVTKNPLQTLEILMDQPSRGLPTATATAAASVIIIVVVIIVIIIIITSDYFFIKRGVEVTDSG